MLKQNFLKLFAKIKIVIIRHKYLSFVLLSILFIRLIYVQVFENKFMVDNSQGLINSIRIQQKFSRPIAYKLTYLNAIRHVDKYGKVILRYKLKHKIYFNNKRLNTIITNYNYVLPTKYEQLKVLPITSRYQYSHFARPYKVFLHQKYLLIFSNKRSSSKLMWKHLNSNKIFKLSKILYCVNQNNTRCYQNKFTHNILLCTNTKHFELLVNIHNNRVYQLALINKSINSKLKILTYSHNQYYLNQHFSLYINYLIYKEHRLIIDMKPLIDKDCDEVNAHNTFLSDVEDGLPEHVDPNDPEYQELDHYGLCSESDYDNWSKNN